MTRTLTGQHFAGVLAGGGTDLIHAEVPAAPATHQQLGHALPPSDTARTDKYSASPSRFFLGERALVNAAVNWAERTAGALSLGVLRLRAAHIGDHTVLRMHQDVRSLRAACTATADTGLGVFVGGETTAVRAILADAGVKVLTAGTAEVAVLRDGLLARDPAMGTEAVQVVGWRAFGDSVEALTRKGTTQIAGPLAQLLMLIGRRAPEVSVRAVPLRALLAPFLVFVSDATEEAMERRQGMMTYSVAGQTLSMSVEP